MKVLMPLLGGVELGGTKCVCLIGTGPGDIRGQIAVPTGGDANETLSKIEDIFRDWHAAHGPIAALGIASFGPVDLNRSSARYGFITSTTKPGWRDTDVARRLAKLFPVPVGFDTDVNGAALAEGRWGAAKHLSDFAYVTVGTGVGAGLVIDGRPAYGFCHSELGHIRIARKAGDVWHGACAFHGDCVEGLASGVAIAARAGRPASQVPPDSPLWELVAHALAQLLHTIVLATAPRRIFIGGGVIEGRPELLECVRRQLVQSLNGYSRLDELAGGIERYAVPPGLGSLAGPLGALALAADTISPR
ncbi:MAG TPA: ROK family protein [Steroidobacteraceae bacterium]|jgi:fructokinase|nr:ROK family protein [Steroidobacteraceae bacterium]